MITDDEFFKRIEAAAGDKTAAEMIRERRDGTERSEPAKAVNEILIALRKHGLITGRGGETDA